MTDPTPCSYMSTAAVAATLAHSPCTLLWLGVAGKLIPAVLIFCKCGLHERAICPLRLSFRRRVRRTGWLGSDICCCPWQAPCPCLCDHLASIALVAVLELSVPLGGVMHARPTYSGASCANARELLAVR